MPRIISKIATGQPNNCLTHSHTLADWRGGGERTPVNKTRQQIILTRTTKDIGDAGSTIAIKNNSPRMGPIS